MSFKTTLQADNDIIGIYLHGYKTFGKAQAEKYHTELNSTFTLLSQWPLVAKEYTQFSPSVRVHFHQSHVIAYILDNSDILILRVLHNRQDWEQYFL